MSPTGEMEPLRDRHIGASRWSAYSQPSSVDTYVTSLLHTAFGVVGEKLRSSRFGATGSE